MDDKTTLLGQGQQPASDAGPLYHDTSHSPTQKFIQSGFVVLVAVMVGISVFLGIYKGATATNNGGIFFMLSFSLIGFILIQLCVLAFIRRGEITSNKSWFLYAIGICTITESILTNILLFGDV